MPRHRLVHRYAALLASLFLMSASWGVGCASGSDESGDSILPSGGSSGQEDAGQDASQGTGGVAGQGGSAGSGGSSVAGGGHGGAPLSNGVQCAQCYEDEDCESGKLCVTDPNGRKFCAADCTAFSCKDGYDCVDLATYEQLGADSGAAGSSGTPTGGDAGPTEAGSSDASPTDAGSSSHHGRKGCVPPNNESCACTTATEGFKRTCFNVNGQGTCVGSETCTAGSWVGCDAATPGRETCDGVDNNCDGLTDEQDTTLSGNDLCSDTGSGPPHSSWVCQKAKCVLGACDDGWTAFPDSLPSSAGCACHLDQADTGTKSNDKCTQAVDLGSIKDDGKGTITVVGTISSDTDVDWYGFRGVDGNTRPAFNHYRVHVAFTSDGNPNDEFRLDVYRSTSSTVCTAPKPGKNITSYDWCADSTTDKTKPADADQSANFRFRVYRAQGAVPTCLRYKVQITNYGSGACPTPDACGK